MSPWIVAVVSLSVIALIGILFAGDYVWPLLFFVSVSFGLIFYFLPAAIARRRKAKHSGMIVMINTLFGWTVLGWIAALIWAIVEASEESPG